MSESAQYAVRTWLMSSERAKRHVPGSIPHLGPAFLNAISVGIQPSSAPVDPLIVFRPSTRFEPTQGSNFYLEPCPYCWR